MNQLLPFIPLAIGLALGGIVVWLVLRARAAAAIAGLKAQFEAQVATLSERVSGKDQQLAVLQAGVTAEEDQKAQLAMQLQQESNARAAVEERANRVPHLEARLAESQTDALRQ